MGEAKRKMDALRAEFLAQSEQWTFPASEWEARSIEEIKELPFIKVHRPSDEQLEWMRMPAKTCHANARFMEENDPDDRAKRITGWWLQEGNYVLHSIVNQLGNMICVTPSPYSRENPFDFIPDAKIEWREEGDYFEAYRDDVKIGPGLRSDPAKVLAECEDVLNRLLSGMNPYKAVQK